MKLFGHADSGHAFKVRLYMIWAGIDHDFEVVDIFQPRDARQPEFMRLAPFGEVPLLIDGDRALAQSNAILWHLATQVSNASASAHDSGSDQTVREWLFWEANKIGMCLPQLRADRRFKGSGLSDGAREWLLARYTHDADVMNTTLSDGRDWIAGTDQPSIADFSLCGYLFFADEAQVEVPSHVQSWLQRLARLPGWQHPYALLAESSKTGTGDTTP